MLRVGDKRMTEFENKHDGEKSQSCTAWNILKCQETLQV